ncbi:MAG: hypothetical protein Q9227_007759 [Pyrenula ochraceoflavens]
MSFTKDTTFSKLPTYHSTVLDHWDQVISRIRIPGYRSISIDGASLDLASVVAFARYNGNLNLAPKCMPRVEASERYLATRLAAGDTIYGYQADNGSLSAAVNTGFGGSSDVRNGDLEALQRALLRTLQAGVIAGREGNNEMGNAINFEDSYRRDETQFIINSHAPTVNGVSESQPLDKNVSISQDIESDEAICKDIQDERQTARSLHNALQSDRFGSGMAGTIISESWVRAAMLVRCNSLARGHSGISRQLLQNLVQFMRSGLVPLVPLRGSISASGDLAPLSYVAGALCGSPTVDVWQGHGSKKLVRADLALEEAGLEVHTFGPKEVISFVNGTAFSAGPASLALHDAHCFAVLTQVLTAMTVEALEGTAESFAPFFSQTRPHEGQSEAAHNIRFFLQNSRLLKSQAKRTAGGQWQDRYATRTAAQWIGPSLQELSHAHHQIETECNSTTDNPLIDAERGSILHGGNFQAMSITSAMEATRSALHIFGRMLFSQLTEMINPSTNFGLPPNLTAEDPNCDFLMKGIDIHAAAYTSELGFLAGRITPHVMSAEMHNQSINSLAFLSTRYTFTALDTFTSLAASMLIATCQALDLRVIHLTFLDNFHPIFEEHAANAISCAASVNANLLPEQDIPLSKYLWTLFQDTLTHTTTLDPSTRFHHAATAVASHISLHHQDLPPPATATQTPTTNLLPWSQHLSATALSTYLSTRDTHAPARTLPFLGIASKRLYSFVRNDLAVPFLRVNPSIRVSDAYFLNSRNDVTVGSYVSRVFDAMKDGRLMVPVMECLREANRAEV